VTTLVEGLAVFAASAEVPDDVRASVRQRVLDIVGLAIAASPLPTSQAVASYARDLGGAPQAHAIGVDALLPAPSAALVNGTLAHSLDYDDTHLPSIIHPSAPVVPACLAAAEAADASGADVVRATAVALEICVRLGMAGYDKQAETSLYFERGQHATASCGTIAGAAGAAVLLGLDAGGIAHAMGVAASMASGIIEANRTGGTVKRLHCGWAAHAAVTAAELAGRGLTGPPTVLEGDFGFFRATIDGRFDPDALRLGLGTVWSVPGIFFKPYPANHFTHTTIDAVLALRDRGLRAEDVEAVEVGIAAPTVRSVGEPIERKRAPESGYQAQFSIPYVVAAALCGGGGLGLGLDDFTDDLAREPARRRIASRVTVRGDDACTEIYPHQFPAVVRVRTTSGEELVERRLRNRGGPGDPLSDSELALKFRENAGRVLSPDAVSAIEEAAKRLDVLENAGELLARATREGD
jgi:2-methylcitrate dehydratase PrpD